MAFDFHELQDILVCPKSKSPLVCAENSLICTDPNCRLMFALRDEIPVMLLDEATELSQNEWTQIIAQQETATASNESASDADETPG